MLDRLSTSIVVTRMVHGFLNFKYLSRASLRLVAALLQLCYLTGLAGNGQC
jgi:hypothetical protein